MGGTGGVSSLYSHSLSAPSFVRPVLSSLSSGSSYLMTSRLLSSCVRTTEGIISASHAQQAEASPPGEEEEEEEEETKEEDKGEEEGDDEVKEGEDGEWSFGLYSVIPQLNIMTTTKTEILIF